jgi:hypothetical protein
MATVDQPMHTARALRSSSRVDDCHHGRGNLAEVIMIRTPQPTTRSGLFGSLVTMARVFASPRVQATPVRSTPHPPSSPASLSLVTSQAPNDAA